jgi:hypothetical protein
MDRSDWGIVMIPGRYRKEYIMHRMITLIFILVIGSLSVMQSTSAQTTSSQTSVMQSTSAQTTSSQATGTITVTDTETSGGTSTTNIVIVDALGNPISFAFTINPGPPGGNKTKAKAIVNGLATITGSTVTQNKDGRGNRTNIVTSTAMGTNTIQSISITPGNGEKDPVNLPPPSRDPLQVSLELSGTTSAEDFSGLVSLVVCGESANTNGQSISDILGGLALQIYQKCAMPASVTNNKLIIDNVEPGIIFVVSLGDQELEVTFSVDLVP